MPPQTIQQSRERQRAMPFDQLNKSNILQTLRSLTLAAP